MSKPLQRAILRHILRSMDAGAGLRVSERIAEQVRKAMEETSDDEVRLLARRILDHPHFAIATRRAP